MTYYFLLLNLFLVSIPFFLVLDRKVFVHEHIRAAIPAALISGIIFSAIAVFFTIFRIWSFNPVYLIGVYYREVPLEQYLFSFTFSFAGLSLYNYLNAKFPSNHLQHFSFTVSNLLLGICAAFLFFTYMKWYSVVTFTALFLLLLHIEYLNKLRFMYRFYRLYVLCLIPFYISYGILCNLPVIQYLDSETVKLRIANIPLENHFYIMAMLLLGVFVMEFFKSKRSK